MPIGRASTVTLWRRNLLSHSTSLKAPNPPTSHMANLLDGHTVAPLKQRFAQPAERRSGVVRLVTNQLRQASVRHSGGYLFDVHSFTVR